MKFHLLHMCLLIISLVLVGAHATSPEPEVYWKSVLPSSPMPKIIKDLLYTKAWNNGMKEVSTNVASRYITLKGIEASWDDVKDSSSPVYIYGASKDQVKDSSLPFYNYEASKDQVKDSSSPMYIYGASKDKVKDPSLPFYNYEASKDQVKDSSSPMYIYGASKDQVKDSSLPFNNYGASKDQVKDSTSPVYIYGASKDQVKDSSLPFYNYGASKDQVKDLSSPVYIYGSSKDQVKDSSLPFYNYGASKDQVKDSTSPVYIYGASKDQVKDSSLPFYNYEASKDQVKDLSSPVYIYGASKDQVKDSTSPVYIYGASKDKVKDSPLPVYNYGASKDQVKDSSSPVYIYGVSKNQVKDSSSPVYFNEAPKDQVRDQPPQFYSYGASGDDVKDHPQQLPQGCSSAPQFQDDPITKLLFLETNLLQGEEMKLHFTKNDHKAPFLPRKISDSMPFSSEKLSEIYDKFSVKPNSMEAEIMKQTLKLCEYKGIEGEELLCATSLESMIDFSTTKLGKKVKAISSVVNAKESTPSQMYIIEEIKKLAANKVAVCHIQNYAYAVFYCHISAGTRSYVVSLEGKDGTKVKAVAVCHTDTSKWNSKHVAFQLLKVTLGTPVCHFLPEDHVLWVPY